MMKVQHIGFSLLLAVAAAQVGCIKENEKAAADSEAVYDYDVSKNRIFFDREVTKGNHDIFKIRRDGTHYVNHTNTPNVDERWPVPSHNYQRLCFTVAGVPVHSDIWGNDRVEMPSGAFVAGTFAAVRPSWSNRSNYITFHDQSDLSRVYYAFTDYNAQSPEGLVSGFVLPENDKVEHASFVGEQNQVLVVRNEANAVWHIELLSSAGYKDGADAPISVYSIDQLLATPTMNSDAGLVAFVEADSSATKIKVITTEGNLIAQIGAGDTISEQDPSISPDGTAVVYASNETGNWELYVFDLTTLTTTNITNTPNLNEQHPHWN